MIPAPSTALVRYALPSQVALEERNGLYRSPQGAALVRFAAPPEPTQTRWCVTIRTPPSFFVLTWLLASRGPRRIGSESNPRGGVP